MAKQTKVSHKFYSAWNYAGEIADLNLASEQGWQLIRGGCFSSRFTKDDSVRYLYQLDYQPRIEDMSRYLETFREQGWEYINSTYNGWHYFRKLYDPSLPPEQYEIFTDPASLQEMHDRWTKLGRLVCIFFGLYFLVQLALLIVSPNLPTLLRALLYGSGAALFGRGVWFLKNPEKRQKIRWDSLLLALFLAFWAAGNVAALCLDDARPNLSLEQSSEQTDALSAPTLWTDFTIRYPDCYEVDCSLKASVPVTLSIADENGQTVYSLTGSSAEEGDVTLRLHRGQYRVYLSDFAGGSLHAELELD